MNIAAMASTKYEVNTGMAWLSYVPEQKQAIRRAYSLIAQQLASYPYHPYINRFITLAVSSTKALLLISLSFLSELL